MYQKSTGQNSGFHKLLYCLSRFKLNVLDTENHRLHELCLALDFSEGELNNSYEGCYETPSKLSKVRTDSYNSNKECAKFCGESTDIFGTSGDKCYCLDEVPSGGKRKSDSECNTRCPDAINPGSILKRQYIL